MPDSPRFQFADYDVTLELRERQVAPSPDSPPEGARARPWRAYRWVLHGPQAGREQFYRDYPDLTAEGQTLYLLSLVVALEWDASATYRAHLRRAFRLASDYLYDATDGRMAFGEIEFVGYEERERAHLWILASNRVHPRCQMEGLHRGVAPAILLGRGLWLPRYEMALPWDEPEGFRTIIHEVAHAALGLPDAYLTRIAMDRATGRQVARGVSEAQGLWIPAYTPDSYSMMGWPLIGSELPYAEEQLRKLFPLLPEPSDPREGEPDPTATPMGARSQAKKGPLSLPLPLPRIRDQFAERDRLPHEAMAEAALILRGDFAIRHYDQAWLYVWRESEGRLLALGSCLVPPRPGEAAYAGTLETDFMMLPGATPLVAEPLSPPLPSFPLRHEPERSLWEESATPLPETRAYRCEVVGVQAGDSLLLVVEEGGKATRVYGGILDAGEEEVWLNDVTPPSPLPTLAVVPSEQSVEVRVVTSAPLPDTLWLFPLGAPEGVALKNPTPSAEGYRYDVPVSHLDGYLLSRWGEGAAARFLVTMFSQGGTGPGHDQVTSPPTAGALDASAMLFFGQPPTAEGEAARQMEEPAPPLRLLTTQGHRSGDDKTVSSGPFTLASNQALSVKDEPTLVFFYQGSPLGPGEYFTHRPLVQRQREDGTWEVVDPTYVTTRRLIAAVPLTPTTAPTLYDKAGGIERYRLVWVEPQREEAT